MTGPTHEVRCPECRESFAIDAAVRITLTSGRVLICPHCATRLVLDADTGEVVHRSRTATGRP